MSRNLLAVAFLLFLSYFPIRGGGDLFSAIRADDVKSVEALLKNGADPNGRNLTGATPLMQAALHASPAMLKLLIERGADPNGANPFGATALMWAAGDAAKVRLLLDAEAKVNAKAASGRTALIIAATFPGNSEALRLLLSKGANPKQLDQSGEGPLTGAAGAADPEMLKLLLAHGATLAERGQRGSFRDMSPLMRAAGANCVECGRILLDQGDDANAISADVQVVKAGLQQIGKMTPLLIAASFGSPEMVQALLDKGASLEARDARGLSALMLAATNEAQNPEVVRILLARGARPDHHSKDGETALSWARKYGQDTEIARLMSERGGTPGDALRYTAPPAEAKSRKAREAVEKSIALLQESNAVFFRKSGCVGCHHQMLSGILAAAAQERGLPVNGKLAGEQLRLAVTVTAPARESHLQRVGMGGAPMTSALFLVALAAQNHAPDALTDAMVHDILGLQRLGGFWETAMVQRPPLQYSPFTETAYSVRAVTAYASPGRKAEIARRVARTVDWFRTAKPPFHEDRVMQLLGLHWAGESLASVAKLAKGLLADQLPDGSWAQRPDFPGDAYATGQALYALHVAAGLPVSDPAYQRGVQFLLRTQYPDGSWWVRSRAVGFQPYFESAFPHGHDQWISAAATSWAALALAMTVEPPRVSAGR